MFVAFLIAIFNSPRSLKNETREEIVKDYRAFLKQSFIRVAKRERFLRKLKRVKAQRATWDQRCQVLKEIITSVEAKVKDVCARKNRTSTTSSRLNTNSQ